MPVRPLLFSLLAGALASGCLDPRQGTLGGGFGVPDASVGVDAQPPTCDQLPPLCAQQQGVCAGSRATVCDANIGWQPCDDASYRAWSADYASEERCDGLDNTCDGEVDTGFDVGGSCGIDPDPCSQGLWVCDSPTTTACEAVPVVSPQCCELTLKEIAAAPTAGRSAVNDIEIRDTVAYLAAGTLGFHVVDVSDPTAPVAWAGIDTIGDSVGVEVIGNTAYLADSWDEPGEGDAFYTIDVSNPKAPQVLGAIDDLWLVKGLGMLGPTHAVIAEYDKGLRIVDVSVPTAPTTALEFAIDEATGVWTEGNMAYVITSSCSAQLVAVDLTDPLEPQVMSQLPVFCYPHGLHVSDGTAFVSDYDTIQMVNVESPGTLTPIHTYGSAAGWRVRATRDHVFTFGQSGHLRSFTRLDDGNVSLLKSMQIGGSAGALQLDGGLAFLGMYAGDERGKGLVIVDVADPASPSVLGELSSKGEAVAVDVEGGFAYVADAEAGLAVLSLAGAPKQVASLALPHRATHVDVEGTRAYVVTQRASDPASVVVVDVAIPAAPKVLDTVPLPGRDAQVKAVGTTLYVAAWEAWPYEENQGGLVTFDVSVPTAVQQLSQVPLGKYDGSIAVQGSLAAIGGEHVTLIDVADPAAPVVLGATEDFVAAGAVAFDATGNWVYAANRGNAGPLQVIDVSDLSAPQVVGEATFEASVSDLAVYGDYVFAANGQRGVTVYDVSSPLTPTAVLTLKTPSRAYGVVAHDGLLYVADGAGLLRVLEPNCEP